jgi:hypothetical protein
MEEEAAMIIVVVLLRNILIVSHYCVHLSFGMLLTTNALDSL